MTENDVFNDFYKILEVSFSLKEQSKTVPIIIVIKVNTHDIELIIDDMMKIGWIFRSSAFSNFKNIISIVIINKHANVEVIKVKMSPQW